MRPNRRPSTLALPARLALTRERGLVEAAGRSATGRVMTIAITGAGRDAFAEARAAWSEAQDGVLEARGESAPAELDGWLSNLGFVGMPEA